PDVFLLGDFAEAFSNLCYCQPIEKKDILTREEFVDAFDGLRLPLYRPENRSDTLSLLRPEIRVISESCLRRDIFGRYTEINQASKDPLIIGDQFLRWESVATIPTFQMFIDLRSVASERSIMFDRDVHELLEVLPSKIRNGANFGAMLVRKLSPSASWVPSSNTLVPLFWSPWFHRFAKECRPILGKLRRLYQGDSFTTTGAWHKKSVLYKGDPQWRGYFEEILCNPDLFGKDIFEPQAISSCWKSFLAGDSKKASDVEKLMHLGVLAKLLGKPLNISS
ncbi:MAG: hypothetical protein L7F78_22650, partial [Syntrophales bacterium LBB04]|nr:hypothetical protein [Syntrophales bacterium LBB04]